MDVRRLSESTFDDGNFPLLSALRDFHFSYS